MTMFFPWARVRHRKTVWFSLLVMFTFGMVALLAPWIAPHDPYRFGITKSNLPPMWVQDTSIPGVNEHPLGTDRFGRDLLSRLIYGMRTALFLALTAVPMSALFGTTVGLIAGFAGGKVDTLILFITDMIQTLPGIMFMVIIVLILRNMLSPSWLHGLATLIIGFAAVSWTGLARLIRVNTLLIKSQLFFEAAISLGASKRHLMSQHLLPNVLHVILVWMINNIPGVILLEAVLGYIGIGVTSAAADGDFTVVSWGGMFFSGRSAINRNPLMLVIPSLCILLISMSFILLGDLLNEITRHEQV